MERKSGILMHISSLYGDYSCGSFGKSAYNFIDFLKECGFSYWQTLPFCIPDENNSPYTSQTSFGGNPYFIDLDILYSKGLITKAELTDQRQVSSFSCDFHSLRKKRLPLLKKAALRVTDRNKIEKYISNYPRLKKCCEFLSLKEANGNTSWNNWKTIKIDEETLFAHKFIQYEFHTQWARLHRYANDKGIKIIGDLPFYVAYDSCDVWSDQNLFLLGNDKKPLCVAGVPPDYFSKDGQLWGNPIYDWKLMKRDRYSWWKDRFLYTFELFDIIRIDHFRAFSEYWAIPANAKTAKEGEWIKGPAKEMIDVIKSIAKEKNVIAENLGIVDEKVNDLLKYSNFPGMSVFQFGFDGNTENGHLPHNYKNNLFAYTGTHDNNTLLGFIWELDNYTRRQVLDYVGYGEDDFDKCCDAIIRMMLMSPAGTVIFPIQDILKYGADTRMNVPGVATGNWSYRITKQQLDSIDKEKYAALNKMYSR